MPKSAVKPPESRKSASGDESRHSSPPRNVEAEESLLSAIMLDNDVLDEVSAIISPNSFYRTKHGEIFNAMLCLSKKREPIDAVTLAESLKGRVEAALIAGLLDVPMAINPMAYAKIISDKARLRDMIRACGDISRKCFTDTDEVEDVFGDAESEIYKITQAAAKKPTLKALSDLLERNIELMEDRQRDQAGVSGVPTGYADLDSMLAGMQKSDLIVLAARPSQGKTALAMNIARNAAMEGVPVAVFSLEMSSDQLTQRLVCSEARVDLSRVRGGFLSMTDWQAISDSANRLSDARMFIDDTAGITVSEIRSKCRKLSMDNGLGLVVIDYLQLMTGNAAAERRDLEVGEISRSLKALAKELDIPVIALSQLNRKLEERVDKRPVLSDLRDSGAIEQDSDVVMFIFREEVYSKKPEHAGKAELIIAKQRNGPIGTVNLTFLHPYTRFENAVKGDGFI